MNCNSVYGNTESIQNLNITQGGSRRMISSTHAVAWVGSKMLGGQLSNCSSVMAVELSNWLAVVVDGKTNISSSPWLVTPCISWHFVFLHTDQLKQLHQLYDFDFLATHACCSDERCLTPRSCYQRLVA